MKRLSFRNRSIEVAGNVYLPPDFNEHRSYPALVLATPGSSVKEQIGAIYAAGLAEQGFVALTFDPSYQGESGDEPRDMEDPPSRVEDIRRAVDFLTTLVYVYKERIGLLGICVGGGYAINAALTEYRFKAVGTVVANDIGRASTARFRTFAVRWWMSVNNGRQERAAATAAGIPGCRTA
ncbi:alpha/beta hydrolase [Phyllobacterium myrsinacearum]|uniref:Fermentation-respiration switch protein FrsA (DUF1100 family) n=1 Tax=Phyllobacterium myrsinacearum TaxID=28101 RepID=A0A839EP85_9HYPH|nr:alpha/beta hydrolase [Phyllobacterium myrsinacearum]MBA8881891.1 fermentation-respiration switch protein FrsA (DUF1100 family) [Phyllobacterium myrsinacearum]